MMLGSGEVRGTNNQSVDSIVGSIMQFGLFQTAEQYDLYVAIDLTTKSMPVSGSTSAEILEGTKTFRRLDATYLLWLESRVANIESAYRKGKASVGLYKTVQQRFVDVQKWARNNIDAAILDALRKNFDPKSYSPPVSEPTPPVTESWSDNMREAFEERAAIMEYDGGMTRAEAERAAERTVRNAFQPVMGR